jgi:prepilin-type N-terminal cleavage/methylation domain-containing protein
MRKINQRNREQGFTLVELLIVMILISILSLAIANFIADWLQASSRTQVRASLLLDDENAMDTITNDIRLSGNVDTNNRWADTYGPGGQFGWQSGTQVLVLAKIATDKNNNVIFSDTTNYITLKDNEIYYLSGKTLYRRTLDSNNLSDAAVTTCPPAEASRTCPADTTIATGVSSLAFAYYDANNNIVTPSNARSVQVSITTSQLLDSQTFSESYTTRMVFRNE